MRLTKFLPIVSLALFIAIASPASSAIVDPASSPAKTEDPRAQQLMQRLEVIKGMDKSELTGSEKKDLRKEVRGIKKEMKEIKGGVYLSVGAIIIVILLLILLL
ncbi:MAG: hypothetical protein ABIP79_01420 [Chitinophagaceae bacterium]